MRTLSTVPVTPSITRSHAHALVTYAHEHTDFQNWMIAFLCDAFFGHVVSPTTEDLSTVHHSGVHTPHTKESAIRRVRWLVHVLVTDPREQPLRDALLSWAQTRERPEPKAIILGIEVGVLPVGLMGKMKIKREPMTLLLKRGLQTHLSAQRLVRLTHEVVERGLTKAHGKTSRLEPELADWLFGDKSLALYSAPAPVLSEIRAQLDDHDAVYAAQSDKHGLTAIALSPALNTGALSSFESCCALDSEV